MATLSNPEFEAKRKKASSIAVKRRWAEYREAHKFVCDNCGRVNIEKYGSGKYCSKECSKKGFSKNLSKAMKGRTLTEEHKEKLWANREKRPIMVPYQVDSGDWWIKLKEGEGTDCKKRYYVYLAEVHLIKRKIKRTECVHHINEDRSDNRLENLKVVTRKEHANIHKSWSK